MEKYILIILSVLVVLTFVGCKTTNKNQTESKAKNDYKIISMEEAISIMEKETEYIILDVRRPDEFAEKHIPNAINIPNENIKTEDIAELPDKNQLILVYCRSGNRSKQASKKLVALGYTNIIEFGGIIDWPGEVVTE